MKIKYFSYITEQSFKTLPNGERVFYYGLPWSKPYVLPDKEIEQRIYRKLLWINRILLGTLILGQPFLFMYIPIIEKPVWWFVYLSGITFFFWAVSWIVLRKDLLQIQRTKASATFSSFYYDMAKRHSKGALLLGLLVSLAFVVVGIWLLFGEKISFYIGLANIVFFTAVAIGWGYTLSIKSKIQVPEKDEKTGKTISGE